MGQRSNGINKTLLLQLIAIVGLFMLITCSSGCRTGGKKINSNSSGIISISRSSGKWINPTRSASPPAQKLKAVRTQPEPTKTTNAIARIVVPEIKASGGGKDFTPTIKVPPVKVEILKPDIGPVDKIKLSMNVLPQSEGDDGGQVIEIISVEEKGSAATNWNALVSFYLIALVTGIFGWFVYKAYKGHDKKAAVKKRAPKKRAPKKKS